ncbi:hypothetical protein MMC16_007865 [Acarospora aff. strigata]|nr:hypothetical protein [Acarospora aff. strigata]
MLNSTHNDIGMSHIRMTTCIVLCITSAKVASGQTSSLYCHAGRGNRTGKAADGSAPPRKKRATARAQPQTCSLAQQAQALGVVLGPDSQLLPQLIEWVSGPCSSLPPRPITEDMVDVTLLRDITTEMFPVLQHLRQQGFFEKARRDGTWDRWVSVILNWHKEVEGLIRALDSPVYALGSAMPPFLLVARLLKPLKCVVDVHVTSTVSATNPHAPSQDAIRSGAAPSTVLKTNIWRAAGHVLLDIPDCPVELSRAVHVLMGIDPPEAPLGSPISQLSQRQVRTAQALQEVDEAARDAQASTSTRLAPAPVDVKAEADRIQAEAGQLLSAALGSVSRACHSPQLQIGGVDPQLLTALVGAFMAPVVHQLAEAHSTIRSCREWMATAADAAERSESFQALLGVAMAAQSQQIAGLARFQAASVRSQLAPHPVEGSRPTAGLQQPLASPERRYKAREAKSNKAAYKQEQEMQERLSAMPPAVGQASGSGSVSDAAIITDGVQIVYPGSNAEPFWNDWKGRFPTLGAYTCWSQLLEEWEEGVVFASAQKRTVPMAKLEQDMAEGRQLADTPRERWRTMEQGKPFYDRKVLIYSMLDAKLQGLDLDTFMSCYNDKAQDMVTKSKARKAPTLSC